MCYVVSAKEWFWFGEILYNVFQDKQLPDKVNKRLKDIRKDIAEIYGETIFQVMSDQVGFYTINGLNTWTRQDVYIMQTLYLLLFLQKQ